MFGNIGQPPLSMKLPMLDIPQPPPQMSTDNVSQALLETGTRSPDAADIVSSLAAPVLNLASTRPHPEMWEEKRKKVSRQRESPAARVISMGRSSQGRWMGA
jgi:hypothetical protein